MRKLVSCTDDFLFSPVRRLLLTLQDHQQVAMDGFAVHGAGSAAILSGDAAMASGGSAGLTQFQLVESNGEGGPTPMALGGSAAQLNEAMNKNTQTVMQVFRQRLAHSQASDPKLSFFGLVQVSQWRQCCVCCVHACVRAAGVMIAVPSTRAFGCLCSACKDGMLSK